MARAPCTVQPRQRRSHDSRTVMQLTFLRIRSNDAKLSFRTLSGISTLVRSLLSRPFRSVLVNGTFVGIPWMLSCPAFLTTVRGSLAGRLSRQIIRVAIAMTFSVAFIAGGPTSAVSIRFADTACCR